MALQTSVELRNPVALAGNVLASSKFTRINTQCAGAVNAAVAPSGLYWGQAAFYDLDPLNVDQSNVIPGAIGNVAADFAGFVTRDGFSENVIGGSYTLLNGTIIGVLDQGNMWLLADTALAVTDPVHVIINDADPTKIGRLTNAAVSADVIDISAYAKLKGYTTAPLEIIEVSISKV